MATGSEKQDNQNKHKQPNNSAELARLSPQDEVTDFLLYSAPNREVKVEVLLNNETLWLTQKRMAALFAVGVPAISKHLKNIFDSNELTENAVISILETTADDGKKYQTKYYNFDAVISVGYRVNSSQATQFRIWATHQLKELIIKGFVMDDDRLKNGRHFGKDYFEQAKQKAFAEYDVFNKQQKIESDFDKVVNKVESALKNQQNIVKK